jgi:hypothetical protein
LLTILQWRRQDTIPPDSPPLSPASFPTRSVRQRPLYIDRECPSYDPALPTSALPPCADRSRTKANPGRSNQHRNARSRITRSHSTLSSPCRDSQTWHTPHHPRFRGRELQS